MCCSASQSNTKHIGVESLNQLFEQKKLGLHHSIQDVCNHCGGDIAVHITKTSCGYGFEGGALYEKDSNNFCVLCPKCYEDLKHNL
jgi:hypothetical protein